MKSTLLSSLALAALLVSPLHATPVIDGDPLANPDQHIDFSEIALGNNTGLTDGYASLGVTFFGFYYNGCTGNCVSIPEKPDIGNFFNTNTDIFRWNTSIYFTADASAATFNFASNGAQFQMGAYLDGALVESFGMDGMIWGTYGFTDIVFDEIRITNSDYYRGAFLVDDLALNHAAQAVPEPSTWALFSMALAAFGFAGIRRRRT